MLRQWLWVMLIFGSRTVAHSSSKGRPRMLDASVELVQLCEEVADHAHELQAAFHSWGAGNVRINRLVTSEAQSAWLRGLATDATVDHVALVGLLWCEHFPHTRAELIDVSVKFAERSVWVEWPLGTPHLPPGWAEPAHREWDRTIQSLGFSPSYEDTATFKFVNILRDERDREVPSVWLVAEIADSGARQTEAQPVLSSYRDWKTNESSPMGAVEYFGVSGHCPAEWTVMVVGQDEEGAVFAPLATALASALQHLGYRATTSRCRKLESGLCDVGWEDESRQLLVLGANVLPRTLATNTTTREKELGVLLPYMKLLPPHTSA